MRVVMDTNALLSSTIWTGSANRALLLLMAHGAKFYTSKAILDEYGEVVRRDFPKLVDMLPRLMENIASFSIFAEPTARLDVVKEDEDDNRIIECAVAARADCILTYDRHLLRLKEYRGIRIVKPEAARRLLENGRKNKR